MKKFKFFTFAIALLTLISGCKNDTFVDDGKIHVRFDTVIQLKTNNIKEQVYDEAHKVKKPVVVIIDENPDSLALYGWYKDKQYTTQWNFKTDIATESMTLYAKFIPQYEVKYYQGKDENAMSLLATELVFKGDTVPVREDLPDCYENPENKYVTNLIENENGTMRGTKGEEVHFGEDIVNAHTNILLRRSENFYLSPGAISRRFTPVAANAGINGSTIGRISVENDEDGEYAKIDFGKVSAKETVCDPYIIMDNPAIDVTHSKAIQITMKNVGVGTSLSFYWVGKWEINGQWINGKEYHSFAEDRVFKFVKGTSANDLANGSCYQDSNGKRYTNCKDANNDWVTYTLPISERLSNGVSVWGCAGQITALRIQSSFNLNNLVYNDENINNVILIKSIKGVDDPNGKTYGFNDDKTNSITSTGNDSQTALTNASNSQTSIDGFIFPKDNDAIVTNETLETYTTTNIIKKTDGTYFYANYVDGPQTIVLKPKANIDLDTLTTFKFKYRNFSYAEKITFAFKTEFQDNGITKNKTVTAIYNTPKSMASTEEAMINMFGNVNYRGKLKELDISFTPIGVDNMLKFEYIKFDQYIAKNMNGFNFNDMYCGGFVSGTGVSLSYNANNKGTKVDVTSTNSTISKDSISFSLKMFSGFELNYVKPNDGITSVKVNLTVDGVETSYTVETATDTQSVAKKVNISRVGTLTKATISFQGTGTIYLKSIKWVFVETSLDLTVADFYTATAKHNGFPKYTYDATELAMVTNTNSAAIYARLGAWGYSVNSKVVKNISMAGKTKILLLYNNCDSQATKPYFSFGAVTKASQLSDDKYLTADATPNSPVNINGVIKSPGAGEANRVNILTNMEKGDWDVCEFEIDPFFTSQANECYLTCFYFASASLHGKNFYIRGFAII